MVDITSILIWINFTDGQGWVHREQTKDCPGGEQHSLMLKPVVHRETIVVEVVKSKFIKSHAAKNGIERDDKLQNQRAK